METHADGWRTFFSAAHLVVDASSSADRKLRLQAGTGFNVFDWIDPSENDLSNIIGDLLAPQGSHGQGKAFLDLAVHQLFPLPKADQPDDLNRCVIVREAGTYHGRRIDLLIDFAASAIGIENKPFAGEAQDQLKDYADWLSERFSGSFSLIFLHGPDVRAGSLGREWRQKLKEEDRFREVPYYSQTERSLHQWLVRCAEICHSDKVRWFLRDFANYVAGRFPPVERGVE